MSKPITITFQASEGLHGWLAKEAGSREMTLGGFVRFMCSEARIASLRFSAPAPVTFEAPATNGRLMTVTQAKRLAKGKAAL